VADGVAAYGVDVSVVPVSGEDGHEGCAEKVDDFACAVANVGKRTGVEEKLPTLACVVSYHFKTSHRLSNQNQPPFLMV
jgi:hypothetical protein